MHLNGPGCRATNRAGKPCGNRADDPSGFCWNHDPANADQRKVLASRAGRGRGDPEVREIRQELKALRQGLKEGTVEDADALIRTLRAEGYVAKIDADIRRYSREIAELEDYAAQLEEKFEELRNGHDPSFAATMYRRR